MTDGGTCDSCGKLVDTLIPIRILCEVKSDYEMRLKHYCPKCFWERVEEWESNGDEDEEEKSWFGCWLWQYKGKLYVGYLVGSKEAVTEKMNLLKERHEELNVLEVVGGQVVDRELYVEDEENEGK